MVVATKVFLARSVFALEDERGPLNMSRGRKSWVSLGVSALALNLLLWISMLYSV